MKLSLFVIAAAVISCGATQAKDTTTFRVDSYVPQRFTDFRWTLSGQMGLDGRDDDDARRYDLGYTMPDEWFSYNYDDQRLRFSSNISYDFVTIPTAYRYALGVQISGLHSKSSGTSNYSDPNGTLKVTENQSSSHNWRFALSPGATFTKYFWRDFYISPSLDGNVAYSDNGSENDKTVESFDSLGQSAGSSWLHEKTTGYSWDGGARTQLEVGIGREYSTRFAFLALSIIEQLRTADLLLREPGYGEITQLCDTILEYRQRHTNDKRYRRIAALTAILKLLRNDGVIVSEDPTLPFILADIWDFYPDLGRGFGYKVGTGCELNYTASYILTRYERSYEPDRTYRYTRCQSSGSGRVILYERLEYLRPLSLRWHLSFYSQVKYMANQYRVRESVWTMGMDRNVWGHESSANVAYYHDNRTSILAGIVATKNANVFRGAEASTRQETISVTSDILYRLSVPTTIRANFNIQWSSIDDADPLGNRQDNQRYNVGVSIEHWLY